MPYVTLILFITTTSVVSYIDSFCMCLQVYIHKIIWLCQTYYNVTFCIYVDVNYKEPFLSNVLKIAYWYSALQYDSMCRILKHSIFKIGLPRQSKTTKLVGFLHSPIFAWAWSGVDSVRSSCSRVHTRCRDSVPCRRVAIEVCSLPRSWRTHDPLYHRQDNQNEELRDGGFVCESYLNQIKLIILY